MLSSASISMPSIMAWNSLAGRSKRAIGSSRASVVGRLGRPANRASISRRQPASCVELGGDRRVAVGDVVDLAAEGIDRVHRVALGRRQQAHAPVERRAGADDHGAHVRLRGAELGPDRLGPRHALRAGGQIHRAGALVAGRRGRGPITCPMPISPHSRNRSRLELDPLGERIAPPQLLGEAARDRQDHRRFRREAPAAQSARQLVGGGEQRVDAVEHAIEHLAQRGRGRRPVQRLDPDARRRRSCRAAGTPGRAPGSRPGSPGGD